MIDENPQHPVTAAQLHLERHDILRPDTQIDLAQLAQAAPEAVYKVLAVDQTASTDKDRPVVVRAVTMELTPAEAETLVKATSEGTLQLTLRNPLDSELVAKKEEKKAPAKKVVRRSAPPRLQVTVIRGTDVSTTSLKKDPTVIR